MNKVLITAAAVLSVAASLVPSASAQRAPDRPLLQNFDQRAVLPKEARLAPPGRAEAVVRLEALLPEVQVSIDPSLQSPRFIHSRHGFLSGPNAQGGAISAPAAAAIPAGDPHRAVLAFVTEHRALFGFGVDALGAAKITRDYVTPHNGLRTTVWQQQLDGIDVIDAKFIGHITRKGELVSISSLFVPDLTAAANAGLPNRAAALAALPISSAQAVVNATAAIEEQIALADVQPVEPAPVGVERKQQFNAGQKVKGAAEVELKWVAISAGEVRPAWQIILTSRQRNEGFLVLIDAQNGQLLRRLGLTHYLTDATYNVYKSDSPSPFSPGWPTPNTGQPAIVPRQLVTLSALSTNASPNGWINDGDNETRGNNVDTFIDWNDTDQPTVARPTGNPTRTFDFALDLAVDPTNYASASVVQLFYLNNWMHDRLYDLGFTEAAGNYQTDNFGRGGLGNDPVLANAQDGALIGNSDNAYFSVRPDGQSGNMAMFVFSFPTPHRDGSLDAEIVLHEYTHGLSWRLVAGGMALGTVQSDSMGEGWSDFYALSLLSEPADDANASFASGGYVTYQLYGMTENYYYGIRRYPYSTDMSKNPLTFKDIDPTQAIPHTGVPMSPWLSPFSPNDANEVHNAGEVWCITLWEARTKLIGKYGTNGNQMMLQLVTDGMRLSPAEPTYLEARDAIIQADQVNNGGANYLELWQAFAKRGMGGSALAPDSDTTIGVVEAFDLPGIAIDAVTTSDLTTGNANGVVDFNECNELTIVLVNNGINAASNVSAVLTATTPGVVVAQPDATYPTLPRGAMGTNSVPFKIYTTPSFICGTPIDLVLNVSATNDYRALKFRLKTGQVAAAQRFNSTTVTPIPDVDQGGAESAINVTGINSAISRVTVSLHVAHPFIFDLTLQLIAPDGSRILLSQNVLWVAQNYGSACSPDSSRVTFDDKAAVAISEAFPPFVGSFRPLQPLELFVGKSGSAVNGQWRLKVIDSYNRGAQGSIQCWSLELSPTSCADGGGDCATDVALGKTASAATAMIGSNLVYTLSVTNLGPNAARGVAVNDPLPAGLAFVNAIPSQGSCGFSAGSVVCNLGTLQVGQVGTVSVIVNPTTEGVVTNIASIDSTVSDSNPLNNSASVVTRIIPPSPLMVALYPSLVSESALPANGGLDPDETVTINFKLRNIGALATTNLIAKLLDTGGVVAPSGQQSYGVVVPFGPGVGRDFTFTASGTNGGLVVASLQLQDGTNNLGTVAFPLGLSAVRTYANQGVINIPSSGAATPYPSTITVSGFNGLASKVSIILSNLTHGFPKDIDALVVSPAGQKVMLLSDTGGGTPVNNLVLNMDDGAAGVVPEEGPFTTGAYRPTDNETGDVLPAPAPAGPYATALTAFNGSSPNGIWQLFVSDDTAGDNGRIAGGWQLNLSILDPVNPTADIGVSVVDGPDPVGIGSNVTYTVVVTNNGNETIYEVAITNTLPAGIAFTSATNTAGACAVAGAQVVCTVDSIPNHGVAVLTIVGNAVASGSQVFSTRISAAALVDFNPANDAASTVTTVTASADVRVTLSALPNPASVGNALVYSVTVNNAGPNTATGVSITNVLPAGVTFVAAEPSQGTCTPSAGLVRCALGNLARNGSATVTIQVTTPAAVTALTNTVRVGAVTPPDPIRTNNTASLVVTNINPNYIIQPAWALLQSESGPVTGGVDPGEAVTISFALRNAGALSTANLVATLLPSGGVTGPSNPQTYGVINPNGAAVARSFSFTANGAPGSMITARLHVVDGVTDLGDVVFRFPLGASGTFAATNAISIPDRGPAVTYPSTITLTGFAGAVNRVSVTLSNLTHSYPDDLDILLVSPSGQKVMLMSDVGGGAGITNVTVTLEDSAATALPDSTVISGGVYRPADFEINDVMPLPAPAGSYANTLAAFNGSAANGVWSLYIADDSYGDSGALSGGWSLSVSTVGDLVPVPPQISAPRIPAKGNFGFTLTGQSGVTYAIEASDDFAVWTTVETITMVGTTYDYIAPAAATHRFYRAWRVP